MRKELPATLTVNDAVALVVNISFLPGTTNLLEMLSQFTEGAEIELDRTKTKSERVKFTSHRVMYQCRELLAQSIVAAINVEIDCIDDGKESTLEVANDEFGSKKLVTASVCAWANELGFWIDGWETPRFWRKSSERNYSTEYLDILDDVIATFCEEGGEHYKPGQEPKNALVSAWIKEKYGPLSDKVIGAMGTLIRPGLSETTKRPK